MVLRIPGPGRSLRRPGVIASPHAIIGRSGAQLRSNALYIDARAEFGCNGADSSTDQTTRYQAAITAAYTAAAARSRNVKCVFPSGLSCVSSLNFTGYASTFGVEFEAPGTLVFYADKQVSTGKPIIDLTGSSFIKLTRIIAAGQTPAGADPSITPSVGFLVAQSSGGGDSNKNSFHEIGSLGKFGNAAIYVFGSTDNGWYNCAFQQKKTDAPCLYAGTSNGAAVTSPYITIATSPGACGDNSFFQVETHCPASGTAYSQDFNGIDNTRFFGGNCDNSGPGQIRFQGTNRVILYSGTKFYSETGVAPTDLIYNNNGATSQLVLECCNTDDNAFSTNLVNGTGTPTFYGGSITGMPAAALTGPYLHFFSQQITLGGPAVNLVGGTTQYLAVGGSTTTLANASMNVHRRMRVVSMRVNTGGAPGAGKNYVFTLFKNGVTATNPTVTVADTNQTGTDLTHAVTFDPGDTYLAQAVPSATAANSGGVWVTLGVIYG